MQRSVGAAGLILKIAPVEWPQNTEYRGRISIGRPLLRVLLTLLPLQKMTSHLFDSASPQTRGCRFKDWRGIGLASYCLLPVLVVPCAQVLRVGCPC